jgi:hypothetical protein
MPQRRQPAAAPFSAPSDPEFDETFLASTADIPEDVPDRVAEAAQTAKEELDATLITPELVKEALGPTFETVFATVAHFRGEHWRLEPFQTKALVSGWTPIVRILLARLGSETEILLAAAIIPTMAIVGGKIAQEATERASSMANGRTPKSEESSASSASVAAARRPAPSSWSEMPVDA